MSTAVFYDLENISKFTTPKNFGEFKDSFKMICESELVDDVVFQRAYISTTHPAYIKYNKFLNSTGIEICAVDPNMNSKKANLVDFKMNVDCVAYALSNNIDTVVIATGDADFGFLCEELKSYGKNVVVASYGVTTNKSIIMLSDDWVDFGNEYLLCDIHELMEARIHIENSIDYKDALCRVIEAMLNDKLIKRYMAMERFDIDMLRNFTEHFYHAPELGDMSYYEFISLLISGYKIMFLEKNGRILILPSDEEISEPPLSLYELVTGTNFDFSSERFKAWHTWFEENIDSVNELVYYINFMTKNKLLTLDGDTAQLVPKRKCAAALLEHASQAVSALNIKPDEKELEKLRSRFYRNAVKNRPVEDNSEPEPEKELFIQGTMTNFGRIVVYADNEAVTRVDFTDEYVKYNANDITMQAMQELREYFKGIRKEFTVPIRLEGSDFQKQVWAALLEIPYGETRTYKDIANAIGKPKGARAVGLACNKNPLLFIIPCHRVINSSGDLSGYAAGTELKTALLKAESSPVDFKRFGKQYAFNIKNPDKRADYRTSEEISQLLDKEIEEKSVHNNLDKNTQNAENEEHRGEPELEKSSENKDDISAVSDNSEDIVTKSDTDFNDAESNVSENNENTLETDVSNEQITHEVFEPSSKPEALENKITSEQVISENNFSDLSANSEPEPDINKADIYVEYTPNDELNQNSKPESENKAQQNINSDKNTNSDNTNSEVIDFTVTSTETENDDYSSSTENPEGEQKPPKKKKNRRKIKRKAAKKDYTVEFKRPTAFTQLEFDFDFPSQPQINTAAEIEQNKLSSSYTETDENNDIIETEEVSEFVSENSPIAEDTPSETPTKTGEEHFESSETKSDTKSETSILPMNENSDNENSEPETIKSETETQENEDLSSDKSEPEKNSTTPETAEEKPQLPRKRRPPYKRRTRKQANGQIQKKYSAKKHVSKKSAEANKEDN